MCIRDRFYFGDSLPDDFRVILADPALTQVYVDQWRTQLMGYGSLDEMTAEQQAEGEQRAWQLFGGQSVSPASALTVPVPLEASSNEAEDMQKPEITPCLLYTSSRRPFQAYSRQFPR